MTESASQAPGRIETWLRSLVLVVALVTPGIFGYLTTYLLLALLLAMTVQSLWAARQGSAAMRFDLSAGLFLLAFAVLAIDIAANALGAGVPADIRYALNFGMFLFYAPLASSLQGSAGPGNAARIADLALLGALASAVVAVFEAVVMGESRAGYIAGDPIRLGNTALLLGTLALMGVAVRRGGRRWLYLAGPVLAVVTIVLAGARSALVALPVVLIVGGLILAPRRGIAFAVAAGGALAAGLSVALLALMRNERVISLIEVAQSLLSGTPLADQAMQERLSLYRAGWAAFAESPVLGAGWHERMAATARHLPPESAGLGRMPHLHNEALNFAVGAGVVGVGAYLLVLAIPIVACLRSPRDSQYRARLFGCVVLVTAYVILGLVDVMVSYELHTALYVVLVAIVLSYCRDAPANASRSVPG